MKAEGSDGQMVCSTAYFASKLTRIRPCVTLSFVGCGCFLRLDQIGAKRWCFWCPSACFLWDAPFRQSACPALVIIFHPCFFSRVLSTGRGMPNGWRFVSDPFPYTQQLCNNIQAVETTPPYHFCFLCPHPPARPTPSSSPPCANRCVAC